MKPPGRRLNVPLGVLICFFFVSVVHADTLYSWSYDGNIEKFTSSGSGTIIANTGSSFNGSVGLAVDGAGNLYSGNPSDGYVTEYTPGGASFHLCPIDSVSGLAFNGTGSLYGTSPNYSSVCKVLPFPVNDDLVDSRTGNLNFPEGIAFDNSGNFYVANTGYENNGGTFTYWGGPGTGTIEKFSPTGVDLGTFATGLTIPYGLAFDRSGNLFVTQATAVGRIVEIAPDGTKSYFGGFLGTGLETPEGLAFDSAGNLFVASAGNKEIVKFAPDGSHSVFADASSGLGNPAAIAIMTIPEPSTWALVVCAVALLGSCPRRRR